MKNSLGESKTITRKEELFVGGIRNRHDLPVDIFIFNKVFNDKINNFEYLEEQVRNFIFRNVGVTKKDGRYSGDKVLNVYTTGLISVYSSIIKVCNEYGVELNFYNYNGEFNEESYMKQKLIEDGDIEYRRLFRLFPDATHIHYMFDQDTILVDDHLTIVKQNLDTGIVHYYLYKVSSYADKLFKDNMITMMSSDKYSELSIMNCHIIGDTIKIEKIIKLEK